MSRRRRALSEDSARAGPPDTGRDPPLPRKRRAPPKGSARTDPQAKKRPTPGSGTMPLALAAKREPSAQKAPHPRGRRRSSPQASKGRGARAGQSPSQRRRAPSEDSARTGPPDTDRDPPLPRKRRAPPEGSARTDLPRNGQGHAGLERTPRRGAALRQQARRALTLQPKKGGDAG